MVAAEVEPEGSTLSVVIVTVGTISTLGPSMKVIAAVNLAQGIQLGTECRLDLLGMMPPPEEVLVAIWM
jgi:hypothetical protein